MTNWKRIIAAAGTAALLISNLGSISQLTFATEQTAQPVTSTDDIESDNGDESEDAELLLQGLKDAEEVDEADDGENNDDESGDSDNKSQQGDPDDDTDIDEEDESSQEESDEGDDADEGQDPDVDAEEPADEEPASEEPTEEETVTDPEEEPKEYDLDDSLTIDLDVKESGNRDVKRNDNGDYLYNIDETASMTLKVSNPDDYALDESDDAVVRLYMQFTDTVSTDPDGEDADTASRGKTKAPGTYAVSEDDDDSYTYSVYEIENGLYCYEFERPIDGDSYSVELTSTYKKGTDGGSNKIWMAVLSADDTKALDEAAAERAAEESDDEDADEDNDERTDDERVIGVADLPEDKDDIVTLRWADPNVPYPAFQNEQTMSDGTVITVDAPEGAFPEGIQLSLTVKDAEDYLDAIRAYTGDETLTAENWLAYDFDFYTDDEHHEIEPLSNIKVTFSNLTRLTELAEEAAAAASDEDADIAQADLDEEVADDATSDIVVYHIPHTTNANDTFDANGVTETTISNVDREMGTVEIETDTFSTQLLAPGPGGGGSQTRSTVDHIDIGIKANATITVDGKTTEVDVTLERSDFTSGNVTVTAVYRNGSGTPTVNTGSFGSITTSTGASGIQQFRVNGTYSIGTQANPAIYTFTLKKNVTVTIDGKRITIPITLTEQFHYYQYDNDCPGISEGNGAPGKKANYYNGGTSNAAGMDFTLMYDLKVILVRKQVLDGSNLLSNGTYNPLDPDSEYYIYATVDKSADSDTSVKVTVDNTPSTGMGLNVEQVSSLNSVTATENQTEPETDITVSGVTYEYMGTTGTYKYADGQTFDVVGYKAYESAADSMTFKNYYSRPLTVEKKWYESDGTEITDSSQLPDSITGTLMQVDTTLAVPEKKAEDSVTLTIKAKSSRGTDTLGTYTVAENGHFEAKIIAYSSSSYERWFSDTIAVSGSATASRTRLTLYVDDIKTDTTVTVDYTNWGDTYSYANNAISSAPTISEVDYSVPDTTTRAAVAESTTERAIKTDVTLTKSGNWKATFKGVTDLEEQYGHSYTYYFKENKISGFKSASDYSSDDKQLTVKNTRSLVQVRLKKTFSDGKNPGEATFTLTNDSGQYYNSVTKAFETIAAGTEAPTFTMGQLDLELEDGTYTLTETKAPDGYNRSEAITVVIADGKATVGDKELSKDTDDDSYYLLEVENTPGYELPDTGGGGALPYELGGSAALLSSMLVGYSRRRRDRKEGET